MIKNNSKRTFAIVFAVLMMLSLNVSAQCFIKSTEQDQGYVTYYMDPELIAQNNEFGIALSVQMVGDKHYLALTYQFAKTAQPVEEKVGLELASGYIIELGMYTMEVGSAGGVELCMAVFFIDDVQIPFLKGSNLKKVIFRTQDNIKHEMMVSSNADALKRQLICFKK
ncbi:MAG TPA: hypothetical protein DCX54_07280 [Flavobacteriales bacterium]|nr:hypothetical protein [Flavobacteriales bacterium]